MTQLERDSLMLERSELLRRAEEIRRQLECTAVASVDGVNAKCDQQGRHDGAHRADVELLEVKSHVISKRVVQVTWFDHEQ